jgi:hypothetical protein
MAVRTTNAEVLQIMDNCTVSTTIIDRLIIAASAIVDKVFAGDGTMSDAMLEEVECWLTAHMLASTLSRTTSDEKLGDAQVTYTGKWAMGLDSTPYGQMVKTLDVTGKIAKMGLKGASIFAIPNFD